ncbi:CLUMA_CG000163, isoform A [Clunio marinus]|uniref:CLUMA_CG000163, isoform A n=1 Tax=Clunio marinus TaxID=568069 RepID=A0A1J1HE54_9DIPT|nr:CLUMA_CG000163, isoform A [Clunio marinus]
MNSSGDSMQKPPAKTNQNIQVYVRIRPTNAREKLIRSNEVVEVQGPRDVIAKQMLDSRTTKRFSFDRAFGMDSQQHEVYAAVVSPMIDEVLSGYNCTVFAYGQTGTGKTYTMVGEEQPTLTSTQEDASNVGIIPRALNHLFDELRLMEVEFAMRVSYLELYNEELCDLLSSDDSAKIRIYDDVSKKGSVIVQGLEEIPVRCKSDVYRLLAKGQERRKTAATLMNAQSSRSHTVFSILVHIKENGNDGEEMLKIGKLNLVDLAGSENISKAGNEKGIRTRESVNINQSLLTLGRVITALVERTPHIPYRESKLTRLLQESLGGRTKTSIIATVSPGHKDLEETLSTLDYAHRAKNIQNKPEINQRLTKKVVLKEYTEEIDRLKRDLNAAREKNGIYLASDTYNDMLYKMETQQKELNEKIHLFKNLKEELQDKNRKFDECQRNLDEISTHLLVEQGKARITEAELSKTRRNLRKTERRYEETKHIVECQEKTENLLADHAKQLIKVVEEASVDSHSLIDSIDRRKVVEENALSVTDLLMRNLSNNILEMRHDMEELKKKHTESTNYIINDLNVNTKEKSQFMSYLKVNLEEIKTLRNETNETINKVINDWKSKADENIQSNSALIHASIREMEKQQNAFKININEKIHSIEEIVMKEKVDNEMMQSQLLQKINEQNAEIDNFCVNLRMKIIEHCKDFSNLSTQLKSKTNLQKVKILEIQKLLKDVEEISNELDPIQNDMKNLNDGLKFLEETDIKSFSEKNSLILGEKIGHLKNIEDSNNEIYEKMMQHVKNTSELIKEDDENVKDWLKRQTEVTTSTENDQKSELMVLESNVSKQLEESETIDQQKLKIINDLIQNEKSRFTVNTQEVKSLVQQTLVGIVQKAQNDVFSKLSNCSIEILQFQEEDVLKYRPTGETPMRKDYKFKKDLVATSPHDRIIKRYRIAKNLSDSQLDASIAEIGTNEDSMINSTPLRIQNSTAEFENIRELKDLEISKVSKDEKENQVQSMTE